MTSLSPKLEAELWELAVTIREAEEKLLNLFRDGKISGTVHTCIGQEFSGVTVCTQMEKGDFVFSNHRGHGHFLSWTRNLEGLFAELLGRESGVCRGIGGSQHLHQDGFFSNGIQGGIVPVSLGLALARKVQARKKIGAVFLGDGTLGEGSVYEGLNLAALWKLPLLFVLEDNGIAQSTPTRTTIAGSIKARPEAFGIQTFEGATEDWKNLYATAGDAISFVRDRQSPAFLLIRTARLRAHSKGDDTRAESEMRESHERDPLNMFFSGGRNQDVLARARAKVERALERAEAAAPAILPKVATEKAPLRWKNISPQSDRYLAQDIHESFRQLMSESDKIFFVGEDVEGPYGGAFKVSKNLSEVFAGRVLNTPISEASLVGLGTGLAMEGFKPFIEIMFGDFILLGADQIVNHAAKFQQMYRDLHVDVTIRTPMGGHRGYGPTHSQSLEKHFLGVPGLRVVALNTLLSPAVIYSELAKTNCGPTLLIENKVDYSRVLAQSLPQGFEVLVSNRRFPVVVAKPQAVRTDVAVFCYGGMVSEALAAAETLFVREEILCQVVAPTQLSPFSLEDCGDVLDEVSEIVFVEEGVGFASFSSEVIAQLSSTGKNMRVHRILSPEICIPSAAHLEKQVLPDSERIVSFIAELLSHRP